MTQLASVRARRRGDRLEQMVRDLPVEVKRRIWSEIKQHAPDLVELIRETNAVPLRFRVREGDGWRDVVSPAIVREYHNKQSQG